MEKISGCGSILDDFFDENTMSVHIKANIPILRKK
jgi:predicted PilT family ATPase